jgi:hypothetical protein
MSSSSSTYFAPKGCLSELQSSAPTPFGLTTYKTFPPVKVAVSIVAIAAEAVALNVERTSRTGRNNLGNTQSVTGIPNGPPHLFIKNLSQLRHIIQLARDRNGFR